MNQQMPGTFNVASQNFVAGKPLRFFDSPAASGRQIVCSFSYIQRVGKRGCVDVWFPSELHKSIAKRLKANDQSVMKELNVEWAAIREFALVQEAEFEEDFNPERLLKAVRDHTKWRGRDGYRVTVVMLGNYTSPSENDELVIHDERLQKEITNLIHMLYLERESEDISELSNKAVGEDQWSCAKALPHVVMHIGSIGMTGRGAAISKKCANVVNSVLNIVEALPSSHVIHDIAVGVEIPQVDSTLYRRKFVEAWENFNGFQRLMSNFFEPLGHSSMSSLHGMGEGGNDFRNVQMRGFGTLRAADDSTNVARAQQARGHHKISANPSQSNARTPVGRQSVSPLATTIAPIAAARHAL